MIHAQQVELKLDRIDADSAYKWLLRKGRERDIMDFFMGKFYFPQYRNKSIQTIPNNQVQPLAIFTSRAGLVVHKLLLFFLFSFFFWGDV